MKINRKEVLEFARRNMQYDIDNPFEATIRAVETWMGKNALIITEDWVVTFLKEEVKYLNSCLAGVEGEAKNDPD